MAAEIKGCEAVVANGEFFGRYGLLGFCRLWLVEEESYWDAGWAGGLPLDHSARGVSLLSVKFCACSRTLRLS